MAKQIMSIQRALSEMKLYDNKINRKLASSKLVSFEKQGNVVNSNKTSDEFVKEAQGYFDSITSDIKNRNILKAAVILSNSSTMVKIGDIDMTVAEAIERKTSIEYDQDLLALLVNQKNRTISEIERHNDSVDAKADAVIRETYGKNAEVKESEVSGIREGFDKTKAKLVSIDKLDEKIYNLESEIETFLKDVDYVLTESNVKTEIEVDLC